MRCMVYIVENLCSMFFSKPNVPPGLSSIFGEHWRRNELSVDVLEFFQLNQAAVEFHKKKALLLTVRLPL